MGCASMLQRSPEEPSTLLADVNGGAGGRKDRSSVDHNLLPVPYLVMGRLLIGGIPGKNYSGCRAWWCIGFNSSTFRPQNLI